MPWLRGGRASWFAKEATTDPPAAAASWLQKKNRAPCNARRCP